MSGERSESLWEVVAQRLALPPQDTGTTTLVYQKLRRQRSAPGAITTASASHMRALLLTEGTICIAPSVAMTGLRHLSGHIQPGLEIGETNTSVLRMSNLPMTRAASRLSQKVQDIMESTPA